jgi:hypothetical protein
MIQLISATRDVPPPAGACRFVARTEESLGEIFQFVVGGLEIGQQVVTLAGPTCLKDLASALGESGLRPKAMLRSGRLVFVTAPDSLPSLFQSRLYRRAQLRLNGSLVRWVSDWSWVCAYSGKIEALLDYQRRVHQLVNECGAISLCTVSCAKLGRGPLLAMMAEHRRVARATQPASSYGMNLPSLPTAEKNRDTWKRR